MTATKRIPSLAYNNESLFTGQMFSCTQCTRGQKWQSKRRFKIWYLQI